MFNCWSTKILNDDVIPVLVNADTTGNSLNNHPSATQQLTSHPRIP